MSSTVQYDVIANLAVKGSFAQMRRMAMAMKPIWNNLDAIGSKLSKLGDMVRGSTAQTAASWAKTAGAVGAVAGPTALGAAVKYGLQFNKTMENAELQAATMYNLFDFAAGAAEVVSGELTQWEYNLQASKAVFKELYTIAEKTPGSFADVAAVYQNAGAGLATQTQDLRRQLAFMEKISLLGGLTHGRYDVLGAQAGRILAGSAGAEMDVWKNLSLPLLKAGQAMKDASGNPIFGKDMKAGEELTLAFNKLAGDTRLNLMMAAMEKIGPEVADAWGSSMDGIMGTTTSALQTLSGRLTKPLYEGFRGFLKSINKNVFGKGTLGIGRWEYFADAAGQKLGAFADRWFARIEGAAVFIRDNWVDIMAYTKNAGVIVAGLIKAAFAWGVTRLALGTAFKAGGGVAKGAQWAKEMAGKLKPVFERQAKLTHAAIVRGAHDKRGGILGGLGKLLGARTNRMEREGRASYTFEQKEWKRGKGGRFAGGAGMGKRVVTALQGRLGADPFRNIAAGLAKFSSIGMVLAAGIPTIVALTVAFGGLFVIVGGIAAYVTSKWEEISGALVRGLQEGRISLMPLLTAAYGFWARLKIVGQAFLGGSDHVDQFNGVLGWMTATVGAAGSAVSFFLRAMAFFIGIWATLKLAMLGVARAILGIVELAAHIPGGPDDDTVARARQNYEDYNRSVWETMETGAQLLNTADQLDNFKFDPMEIERIQKESDKMAKSLEAMLAGKGKEQDKLKSPGPKVKIDKMIVEMDLRDQDPDRIFSQFIKPLGALAERRVESRALPVGGV